MSTPSGFRLRFLRAHLYEISFVLLILGILVASFCRPFRTSSLGVDMVRDCVEGRIVRITRSDAAPSDAELCHEVRDLVTQGSCQQFATEKDVKVVCDATGVRLWHMKPDETRVEFDYDYLRRIRSARGRSGGDEVAP